MYILPLLAEQTHCKILRATHNAQCTSLAECLAQNCRLLLPIITAFTGMVIFDLHIAETPQLIFNFYRAMHFSAKRGIAIACRLSVRPSVCLSVCL